MSGENTIGIVFSGMLVFLDQVSFEVLPALSVATLSDGNWRVSCSGIPDVGFISTPHELKNREAAAKNY